MRAWYVGIARLCRWLYYFRVSVLGRENIPAGGPVLFVALHRNGAVDGCVYASVLPRAVFMISTQLRRSLLGRLFFSGIEVVRDKDSGDRARNERAMAECLALLASGGQLFVMPEGTSSLGPAHLPFHRGAARIAAAALEGRVPLRIVPLGIHYERAWAFRSRVEVVVGPAVETPPGTGLTDADRVALLHERIVQALEGVGVQFESAEQQEQSERLAYVSTLATERSYFSSLKRLERGIPESLRAAAAELEARIGTRRLLRHQGVPLVPMGPLALYAALLASLTPLVAAAAALNVLPLAAATWAGWRFPDDRNVIALWRLLVGLPALVLWVIAIGVVAVVLAEWRLLAGYALLSLIGTHAWYRYKKLGVATLNGLAHPGLREPMLAFREAVLRELDDAAS